MKIYCSLSNDKYSKDTAKKFFFITFENGKGIIKLFLPERGEYAFEIFIIKNTEAKTQYQNICSYIINCITDKKNLINFNHDGGIPIGKQDLYYLFKLQTTENFSPYQEVFDKISFEFIKIESYSIITTLFCNDFQGNSQQLDDYVFVQEFDKKVAFHINFPKSGIYSLDILAKKPNSSKSYEKVYICMFLAKGGYDQSYPYPKCDENWIKEKNKVLISPLQKLFTNERVLFKIQGFKNNQLFLIQNDAEKHEMKRINDIWEKNFNIGNRSDSISIEFTNKKKNLQKLITFKVNKKRHFF